MKIIKGGICAAKGFFASATEANIKYKNRTDMAMIFSKVPAISAGTYTTNLVKAAPVLWDRKITDSETYVNAIVINSGIANACTKDDESNGHRSHILYTTMTKWMLLISTLSC